MLLTDPKVLLLDEPTRGIDVGAKGEIFALLFREAKKGLAVLYVTSEVGEALTASHRIVVMSKGRMVEEFDPRTATRDEIMAASGEHDTHYPTSSKTEKEPPSEHDHHRRPAPAGAAPAAGGKTPARSINLNALLVEGRALIALIIIIAIFAILSDNYLTDRQPDHDHQAGRLQRHRRARACCW